LELPELALAPIRLQRLEHARAYGRELRRRGAHDHRDDVAAVGRLVLEQPPASVGAEVDAVAGPAELAPACHARAKVASAGRGRDKQDMRALELDDLAKCGGPDVGHRLSQRFMVRDDHTVGTTQRDLGRSLADVMAEHERDTRAAELPGELATLGNELERRSRGPAVERLDQRPAVV